MLANGTKVKVTISNCEDDTGTAVVREGERDADGHVAYRVDITDAEPGADFDMHRCKTGPCEGQLWVNDFEVTVL